MMTTSGSIAMMPYSILRISIWNCYLVLDRICTQREKACPIYSFFRKVVVAFVFFRIVVAVLSPEQKQKKQKARLSICWLVDDQHRVKNSHPNTWNRAGQSQATATSAPWPAQLVAFLFQEIKQENQEISDRALFGNDGPKPACFFHTRVLQTLNLLVLHTRVYRVSNTFLYTRVLDQLVFFILGYTPGYSKPGFYFFHTPYLGTTDTKPACPFHTRVHTQVLPARVLNLLVFFILGYTHGYSQPVY